MRAGAAVLLGAAVLAGCGEGGDVVAADGDDGTPAGDWRSTSVTADGRPRALVEGTRVGLDLTTPGHLRAHAGCNTMSGAVTFSGGHLHVTDLGMTEMGCPGDGRHEQDQWLAEFLSAGPAYAYAEGRLDLTSESTAIALAPREVVEPDLPLEGTTWTVTHLTSGPPPGAPAAPDSAASAGMPGGPGQSGGTVTFADGRVTGKAGCVRFDGPATVGDGSVAVGAFDLDDSTCGADQAARAQGVLSVLEGTVRFRTTPYTLTLTHASGRGLQLSPPAPTG